MKLTEEQIKEIAENLDCGLRCYYNKLTGEIKTVIDFDSWEGAEEEPWEEDLKEIEEHWDDYFQFEGVNSHQSFEVMEDFIETLDDTQLQNRLINALNKSKPFRNFKWEVDNSGEYREKWFAYKKKRLIAWVEEQIDEYNSLEEYEQH
jgi:hypothetical protein